MKATRTYHTLLILVGYLILVHLIYWPAARAGMVTDFSGLIQKLDEGSAIDIFNSFGFPSIQPFLNLVYYLHYRIFGLYFLPWHLLYTSLFAINAWLLFRWMKALGTFFGIAQSQALAFCSGLLFLSLPYQSEVVVWKVALSYHLVTGFILMLLIGFLQWVQEEKPGRWWRIQFLFFLSLLTFELSYTVPFLFLLLFFALRKKGSIGVTPKSFFRKIFFPLLLQLGVYFLATRWVIGSWIGHYGAAVHLGVDPLYTTGNFYRYFFKYLFLGRYLGPEWKALLFEKLYTLPYLALLVASSAALTAFMVFRYRKLKSPFQMSLLLLGFFFLALLPVITLYFNSLLLIENDRYGYLASVFFAGAFLSFLFGLPKLIRYPLLSLYLSACLFFTWTSNRYWQASAQVFHGLIQDFNFSQYDHVFILNLPENWHGADLFRDYSGQDKALYDALKYVGRKEPHTQIHEIVQYNLTSANDRVKVEKTDPQHLKVTFLQYGNWWWRRGLGATDYETEWYRFENQGMHYVLSMKDIPPNSVFIYQEGTEWKVFE